MLRHVSYWNACHLINCFFVTTYYRGSDPSCSTPSSPGTPATITCSVVSSSGLAGGWSPLAVADIPAYVLTQVNAQIPLIANGAVSCASTQLVAGVNYKLDYSNGITVHVNCGLPGSEDGSDPICNSSVVTAMAPAPPCVDR